MKHMIAILAVALLALASVVAHAADAVLVGKVTGTATTLTTPSGTTTTGDTCVIGVSSGLVSITSVGDSKGNTYTQIGTTQVNSDGNHQVALWYATNCTGGSGHTASVVFAADPSGTVYFVAIQGATAASFDKTNQTNTTPSSPYTLQVPSTGSLSQANEVLVFLHSSSAGGTVTYASSNTTIIGTESDGDNFWTSALSKVVVSSTSAFTASFTGGDAARAAIGASFKVSAGGGGTPIPVFEYHQRMLSR